MDKIKNKIKNVFKRKAGSPKHELATIILLAVLVVYSVFFLYLVFFGISASLKSADEYGKNYLGLPKSWRFKNFLDVFTSMEAKVYTQTPLTRPNGHVEWKTANHAITYWEMVYNSLMYTFGGTFVASVGPLLMGYCMGRYNFKFNKVLTGLIIFAMSFTVIGATPSAISFRKVLGIYDNLYGEVLLCFGWTSINCLMYQGIFASLSGSYSEAAMMDGANEWQIFFKINLPFAMNLYWTYFLVGCIGRWNSYDAILVFIPSYPTVSYATYLMSVTTEGNLSDVPHRISGAILMLIPTLTAFFIFKNKFIGNLQIGGVKG